MDLPAEVETVRGVVLIETGEDPEFHSYEDSIKKLGSIGDMPNALKALETYKLGEEFFIVYIKHEDGCCQYFSQVVKFQRTVY
jgi:hypothetical protein